MKVLLVSADPVALDSVYCRLINLKPELVPTNYHGEKMGLGHYRDNEIEVAVPGEGVIAPEDLLERYGNPNFNVDRKLVQNREMGEAEPVFEAVPEEALH